MEVLKLMSQRASRKRIAIIITRHFSISNLAENGFFWVSSKIFVNKQQAKEPKGKGTSGQFLDEFHS